MNTLFCIACEKEVLAQKGNPAEFVHETWSTMDCGCPEYDVCEFPLGYTYAPPPLPLFVDLDSLEYGEYVAWCAANQPSEDEIKAAEEFLV